MNITLYSVFALLLFSIDVICLIGIPILEVEIVENRLLSVWISLLFTMQIINYLVSHKLTP